MQTITISQTHTVTLPDYGQHLDISGLMEAVRRSGSHFFDKDTMRYFKSRIDDVTFTGPDGWYFVTSEKHESAFAQINEPRKYTVRRLSVTPNDLRLYELGGFQAYPTLRRARTAARHAAKVGAAICPDCKLRLLYEAETSCGECQAYVARRKAEVPA